VIEDTNSSAAQARFALHNVLHDPELNLSEEHEEFVLDALGALYYYH